MQKIIDLAIGTLEKRLPATVVKKIKNADSELINGSIVFFLTKIIGIGLVYLFAWWVAYQKGAGKWGFITLMITTINVISIFCIFGLDVILIKYTSEYQQKKQVDFLRGLYKSVLPIIFVILLVVVGSFVFRPYFFAKILYGSADIFPWFVVSIIGIPAHVLFQINNAVLAGFKDMLYYGIYKNIVIFGGGLLIYLIGSATIFPIYAERFMEGGILILASYVVAIYVGLFFNSIQVFKRLKIFKENATKAFNNKKLIKQSFPLMLTSSMVIIMNTTDYFMLSHFKSPVEIGLYDIAVKISVLNGIVLMAVNSIASPKFAELFGDNNIAGLKQIVHQSSKLIFWCSFPLLVITAIFPKTVLSFFGAEFIIASNALIILSVGQFVNSVCGSVGNLLKMTDNQTVLQNIIIVAMLINIGLNLVLIPKYSYEGAAVASCISIVFWNLTSVYYAKKRLNIRTFYLPKIFR